MMKYREPIEIKVWQEPVVNPKPIFGPGFPEVRFGPDDKPIPIPIRREPVWPRKTILGPEDKPVPIWGPVKPIVVEPIEVDDIRWQEPGDSPEVILKEPTDDPLLMEPTDDFEDPILDGSKGSNFRWL